MTNLICTPDVFVPFQHLHLLSDDEFDQGFALLLKAKQLGQQARYHDSLATLGEAWRLGYQTPATWERAAWNARQLDLPDLEEAILRKGLEHAHFERVQSQRAVQKMSARLATLEQLNLKMVN